MYMLTKVEVDARSRLLPLCAVLDVRISNAYIAISLERSVFCTDLPVPMLATTSSL